MHKLFIGNLSWSTTDESLAQFFGQVGTVTEAIVVRDKYRNNRSKGFGFVTFDSEEAKQRAINELNNKELDGRAIRIDSAKPPQDRTEGNFGAHRAPAHAENEGNTW